MSLVGFVSLNKAKDLNIYVSLYILENIPQGTLRKLNEVY